MAQIRYLLTDELVPAESHCTPPISCDFFFRIHKKASTMKKHRTTMTHWTHQPEVGSQPSPGLSTDRNTHAGPCLTGMRIHISNTSKFESKFFSLAS
jgi:hypothetical protein